jgi:sugar lactone lactonase YvrE
MFKSIYTFLVINVYLFPYYSLGWTTGNLIVLRVGTPGSGTLLSSNYAPVYLVEINPSSTSTPVSSTLISGVTLSGTDYTQGSLSLSADKSNLYFGGMLASAGTSVSTSSPYGSNARAIVRIDSSETVYTTSLSNTVYNGVIKAVCAKDSSGGWILGNSSTIAVGFVTDGSTNSITNQRTISTSGSPYTGCGVAKSGNLYLLRSKNNFPYIDYFPGAETSGLLWAWWDFQMANDPFSSKQIITNSAEDRFWACIVTLIDINDDGIYTGTSYSDDSMTKIFSSSSVYRVTGIALSPDETLLFFTTTTQLFSVSASCTSSCTPLLITTAQTNTEFRGLASVPKSISNCTVYNNNCESCAIQSSCAFCGQSSTTGLCSAPLSGMCSSSIYALYAKACPSASPSPSSSSTGTPTPTKTISVTPSVTSKPSMIPAVTPSRTPSGTQTDVASSNCAAYNNNCISCASQSTCYFCGQSSSIGVCLTSSSCSSSLFAANSNQCPSVTASPTPVIFATSTRTPSQTVTSGCIPGFDCTCNSGNSAQTICSCNAGYFGSSSSSSLSTLSCTLCGPGTYSLSGSISCTPCPAGTYSSSFSSSSGAISSSTCQSCPSNSYSYSGSSTCSTCPIGLTTFISSSLGCRPSSTSNSVPIDTSFYLSGSQSEGYSAFSNIVDSSGINYYSSVSSFPSTALVLSTGSYISTPLLNSLPTGSSAFSVSSWVKCDATVSTGVVISWGAVESSLNITSATLEVTSLGNVFSTSSGVVTTLAGQAYDGDGSTLFADGTGTNTKFNFPHGVKLDSLGNIYVADTNNNRIRKITPSGVVTTLAGNGTSGFADGTGTKAIFFHPVDLVVDSLGNIYVADTYNHRIRKITSSGVVTTLAGSGTAGFADGTGTNSMFYSPRGIALDSSGLVYVADSDNNRIRKITASGAVTTLAGSGLRGFADGIGTIAIFFYPFGVAADSSGNIYVADAYNHRIRKITSSGVVTTLAGSGTAGFADGTGTNAMFNDPRGVSVDSLGNIYVSDTRNNRIRKITSGVVTTIAGSRNAERSVNIVDSTGTNALFYYPHGISTDSSGNIYVANSGYNRINKITFLSSNPYIFPVCDSSWHHIALTYTGSSFSNTVNAFIDGVNVASNRTFYAISSASTSQLRIGSNGFISSSFEGSIFDICVYSRAISQGEIISLSKRFCPSGHLCDSYDRPIPCRLPQSCIYGACATGYAGFMCDDCSPRTHYKRLEEGCLPCPTIELFWVAISIAAAFLFLTLYYLYFFRRRFRQFCTGGNGVEGMHDTLASFLFILWSRFDLYNQLNLFHLPQVLKDAISIVLSPFLIFFSLEAECALDWSFKDEFWALFSCLSFFWVLGLALLCNRPPKQSRTNRKFFSIINRNIFFSFSLRRGLQLMLRKAIEATIMLPNSPDNKNRLYGETRTVINEKPHKDLFDLSVCIIIFCHLALLVPYPSKDEKFKEDEEFGFWIKDRNRNFQANNMEYFEYWMFCLDIFSCYSLAIRPVHGEKGPLFWLLALDIVRCGIIHKFSRAILTECNVVKNPDKFAVGLLQVFSFYFVQFDIYAISCGSGGLCVFSFSWFIIAYTIFLVCVILFFTLPICYKAYMKSCGPYDDLVDEHDPDTTEGCDKFKTARRSANNGAPAAPILMINPIWRRSLKA